MVILGYRRPLEEQDLWSLNEEDKSQTLVQQFLKVWRKQAPRPSVPKARKTAPSSSSLPAIPAGLWLLGPRPTPPTAPSSLTRRKAAAAAASGKTASGEDEVLLGAQPQSQGPSFPWAMLATFGSSFLISACFKLVQDLLSFVNPQLLRVLIRFTSNPSAPIWWGFLVAVLMFVCSMMQTLFLQQYYHCIFSMGLRFRTVIIGIIYRKALVITNSVKRESAVGEIVNLMSEDAQCFRDLAPYINLVWSAPLQISLAIYFLWQNLGHSTLAGVAVMILMIAFGTAMAMKMRAFEEQRMKLKDSRIKLMNEILGGIKVLKLFAWEPSFLEKVEGIRQGELQLLRKAAYLLAVSIFTMICTPFLGFLITLGVYVSVDQNNVLDAEKAFVSLSLFNILMDPLQMLSHLFSFMAQTSVSLKRIQNFLSQDELDLQCVERKTISPGARTLLGCSPQSWFLAPRLDFQVPKGALVAVVGPVGCGKSSLVSALLGEMEKLEGKVHVKGSVAYVPQQAWIQNCTLQENVLFGQALDPKRYQQTLEACALLADLEMLPAGDQTEIGEKGINLSGGQRQRVSLARAVYSDADIFLLDDPLSAVDSHVAKHIFDQVIGPEGLLAGKTRVLVTHGISFLPQTDSIIVLADGQVSEMGTLQWRGDWGIGGFQGELATPSTSSHPAAVLEEAEDEQRIEASLSHHTDLMDSEPITYKVQKQFMRQLSAMSSEGEAESQPVFRRHLISSEKVQKTEGKANGVLIQEEKAEVGTVKLSVYWDYAKAVGLWTSLAICLLSAGQSATDIGANVWLSAWANDATADSTQYSTYLRLGVYATLGVLQGLLVMLSVMTMVVGSMQAARFLHQALLHNKMRSPQSFFDTTPSGRILNRFSKDIQVIDEDLGPTILSVLASLFDIISTFVVIVASTPLFAVVTVPLAALYAFVQRFYVATSRQLTHLESVSRSAIYSYFLETVSGTSVIRAYNRSQDFRVISDTKVDLNQRICYHCFASNRWLGIRVDFVGNCVVLFAALFAVIGRSSLNPGLVGLSVSYALQVTFALNWMIQDMSKLESNIVAVERVQEYSKTETEAPWVIEGKRPPPGWPQHGEVEFRDYSVRYRPELDLVLKNLSLRVRGGEKVGIVGRTGAGKSFMTLCLPRILEAAEGEIRIDGLNVADIGLHDLRSQLTIIPQDPILFSGTLRMNLDPFGHYSEEDIWQALELSHLHTFLSAQPAHLDFQCSEGGENLR
ncbi:canalicular multispecific organic anion transporter 2-like [Otolemur garnettii]|uniref:canalicular multispecific organic anion transporter 2-like n=1 Tax=Otolemur garnettii TaxID=30611 RepID=UPI000C7F462F|nr:canalicular multispecific organic anion transporter 2-like [Otolemur garnettii]